MKKNGKFNGTKKKIAIKEKSINPICSKPI